MTESTTCPKCSTVSHHPADIREGYCAVCHQFYEDDAESLIDKMERNAANLERMGREEPYSRAALALSVSIKKNIERERARISKEKK
jgi:protein-arginine kinase activator protein McsA